MVTPTSQNDSSTGGYLTPSVANLNDDAFNDFMQAVVAGVTGLPGTMVIPRWQPEPVPLPVDPSTTWAAVGLTEFDQDPYPAIVHFCDNDVGGPGHSVLSRNESFLLFCSFYGAQSMEMASQLIDGLSISQNREVLETAGVKLTAPGAKRIQVPELIKRTWWRRTDVTLPFRRNVERTYAILNLLSAQATIYTESVSESLVATDIEATPI
jgi:hypothetical protein